jgi:hypothetical protein
MMYINKVQETRRSMDVKRLRMKVVDSSAKKAPAIFKSATVGRDRDVMIEPFFNDAGHFLYLCVANTDEIPHTFIPCIIDRNDVKRMVANLSDWLERTNSKQFVDSYIEG